MKHLALVPLIGGMAIGAEDILGTPPEAIVSYSAFDLNEGFLLNWYEQRGLSIPRYRIDTGEADTVTFKNVDVVTSLCPCSGLTSAHNSSGAGCEANTWMLKSTDWILEKARPRVLLGENASRLYTDFGQPVAATMRLIAEKHGYVMTLVKTDTRHHGLPQNRLRAFFMLFRKDQLPENKIPLIATGKKHYTPYDGTWVEFIDSFDQDVDEPLMSFAEDPMIDFLESENKNWQNYYWKAGQQERFDAGMDVPNAAVDSLYALGLVDKFIETHKDSEEKLVEKAVRYAIRAKTKYDAGQNIWHSGACVAPKRYHPSVMFRTMQTIMHPQRRSTLTPREYMRLMGLPESMDVPRAYVNAIAQNVPRCTAGWAVKAAIDSLSGAYGYISVEDFEDDTDQILRQSFINGETRLGMKFGSKFEKFGYVHREVVGV